MIGLLLRAGLCQGAPLLVLVFFFGCALTSTESARQLEKKEVVYTTSIDIPGATIVPKVGGQATYGFGAGDVSVRAGTAIFYNNIGAGLRVYPTDWLNVSLQGDMALIGDFEFWERVAVLTSRVSTATTTRRPFYGGFQTNYLVTPPHGWLSTVGLIGLILGHEWPIRSKRGLIVQFETIISPFSYELFGDDGSIVLSPADQGLPLVNAEFSLAFFRRPAAELYIPGPQRSTVTAEPEEELEKVVEVDSEDEKENMTSGDRANIQEFIDSHHAEIATCYEAQLEQDHSISGGVTVRFEIGDDGSVNAPEISESTMYAPRMEECILKVMENWVFPPPERGEAIEVEYPFNFSIRKSSALYFP